MSRAVTDITNTGSRGGFREYVVPDADKQIGYHVRIKAPDVTGIGAEIWLDDLKLHGVRRYSVAVGINEATEVTITLIADSVNRDS